MKKNNKNSVAGLLILVGLLAIVASYFLVYQKFIEKADALNAQCVTMEADIAKYEQWEANREAYVAETEEMKAEIAAVVNEFPSFALPEDDIKMTYELDNIAGTNYLFFMSLAFADPAAIYTCDYSAADAVAQESNVVMDISSAYPKYTLYQLTSSLGFNATYEGSKNMVSRIYQQARRKGIDSLALNYDSSTGVLAGNVTMNSYYLYGSDKPYAQPNLLPIQKGTENPFGSLEEYDMNAVPTEEEAAEESTQ